MPNQQILNFMNQGPPPLLSERMAAKDMAMAGQYAQTMGSVANTQAQQFENQQLQDRSNILKGYEGRTDSPEFREKMMTIDPQTVFDMENQAASLRKEDREALADKFRVTGNLLLQLDTEEKFNAHPISQSMSYSQVPDVLAQAGKFSEIMKMTGGGEQTVRDKKIAGYKARGLSDNDSADAADGKVKVTSPDDFGNIYTVNTVTNEKKLVSGPGERGLSEPSTQEEIQTVRKGTSIYEAAKKGTGPLSNMQAGISNLIGPWWPGEIYKENESARQQLRFFNKTMNAGLVQGDRFPVWEQQEVKTLLVTPEEMLKDPDAAVSNLIQLRESFTMKIEANERSISSGRVTQKTAGKLADKNELMKRGLSMMGTVPVSEGESENRSLDLANKMAAGTISNEEKDEYRALKGL